MLPITDPWLALVLATVALLLAGLLLAAPGPPAPPPPITGLRRRRVDDSPGCLVGLARYAGILLGVFVPIVLLLPTRQFSIPLALAVLVCVILGTGAVTLAGTGWLALLRRGPDPIDPQLAVTGGLFELGTYTNVQLNAGPRELDDCLVMALFLLVGGLFLLGIIAGGLVAERLLPAPTTSGRRIARGLLCFLYAAIFVLGQAVVLRVVAV